MSSYPLYHTLNKNIPAKDLSVTQKQNLKDKIGSCTDSDVKKAIVMLIAEHATVKQDLDVKLLAQKKGGALPYKMTQTKDDVSFDIENLPIELRWILLKFLNVSQNR